MTSWEVLYERFFDKIEKDADFFRYNNISEVEALELAKSRAKVYLEESIPRLTLNCTPDVDFYNYDTDLETFNFKLTKIEIDVVTCLMREKYFEKDFSLLHAMANRFSTKDMNIFSPANERTTFVEMFRGIVKENDKMIKNYASRDRETGKLKTLSFDQ